MNKKLIIASAILFLPMAIFAKSEKRGVSENQFQFKAQMEALEPGVSWYYNWGNTEGTRVEGQEYFTFIPMCWSQNYSADNIRNYCKNHPETKYILGFNEPNFTAQANMTPQQAAEAWPAVQAIAKEFNLKIVAPALNYSPNPPYTDPTKWMDEFVKLVGLDAFDYTAIHSYGGSGVMMDLATKFHNKYGKDVWVTEFCFWPNEGDNNSSVSPERQIEDMMVAVEWLEKTEWIHKYAWFKAVGNSSSSTGPNYGLLIQGTGEEPRELSEQGKVYLYLNDFNPDSYAEVGKPIAASNYFSQSGAVLGSSLDPDNLSPIEITKFSAGASLDYKFDVPSNAEYNLIVKVTGKGEPERFDPSIAVYSVDSEGNEGEVLCDTQTYELPGNEETYINLTFPLDLKAGKQTIRLKDTNPYRPSGIHFYSVMLADPAGVEGIMADAGAPVNVYNLQGVCVLKNANPTDINGSLTPGIYVIGGKKIYIK